LLEQNGAPTRKRTRHFCVASEHIECFEKDSLYGTGGVAGSSGLSPSYPHTKLLPGHRFSKNRRLASRNRTTAAAPSTILASIPAKILLPNGLASPSDWLRRPFHSKLNPNPVRVPQAASPSLTWSYDRSEQERSESVAEPSICDPVGKTGWRGYCELFGTQFGGLRGLRCGVSGRRLVGISSVSRTVL
jgi:hypothetical protein